MSASLFLPRDDSRSHRQPRGPSAVSGRRRRYVCAWAALVLLACMVPGCGHQAGTYPERPVVLICPWAAGGGTDRVARQLAVGLEQELGVPVNVVNATGASGVTGHTRGALARADGYTITLMTVELNMLHWRGLTSITHEAFRPGVMVNSDPAALFVRRDAPWQTLGELNAHVREHPGQLRASGTALGGIWHVALVGWLTELGVASDAVRWISIEGSSPSLQELMAGGIDVVSCSLPEARSLLEAGEIRALGVMADDRLAQFPLVPTMQEQGVDAVLGTWRGVGLPADTPDDVSAVLNGALERVATGDAFQEFMRKSGFNWEFEGPQQFGTTLARMDGTFGALLTGEAFGDMGSGAVGPMTFPAILGALATVVLLVLLFTGGLRTMDSSDMVSWRGAVRVAEVLGCVLLYLTVAEHMGFLVTGLAITAYLMWRLGVPWPNALATSLVLVVVMYQIFSIYLRVPLPRGVVGW